jgi:PKD repeat protein
MSINDKIYALRAKTELDPIAQFSFEATDLSVDFTNESVDPNNYPLTYVWDFGDTNTSTEADPTHVYDAADTYDVRLTATNSKGIENSVIQSVTVTEPAP